MRLSYQRTPAFSFGQFAMLTLIAAMICSSAFAQDFKSYPALNDQPSPSKTAMSSGPAYYVDAAKGNDDNDGSKTKPWKSVAHGVTQLTAGDTLYLADGVYYENVVISQTGTQDKPITIRSAPGAVAIIDGSIADFQNDFAKAWEPVGDGKDGLYRSKKRYPNLRDIVGAFGDSMVGLQSYWHERDLLATNEFWDRSEVEGDNDIASIYVGPGVMYDRATGYIYVRLAHTDVMPDDSKDYRGVTDPREVPLVLAGYRSTPVHLDAAEHVKLVDLVIRGGGYETVNVDQSSNITFDGVTIYAGTYGLRAFGLRDFLMTRSAVYGNIPPWGFRTENSLRNRPGKGLRDIARLNTHAVIVTDGGREFSLWAVQVNDDWEISYCHFADGHDGPYLGGVNLNFHHNIVERMQDDGMYLSEMYERHLYAGGGATIVIAQNIFRGCLTTLAFGGLIKENKDEVYITRNVFDLRYEVNYGRPSSKRPEGNLHKGKAMGDHGSPPWSAMKIYHNTLVLGDYQRRGDSTLSGALHEDRPRWLLNNIIVHEKQLNAYPGMDPARSGFADGNLYWSSQAMRASGDAFFAKYRKSPQYAASKESYSPGSSTNSLAVDPQLTGMPAHDDWQIQLAPAAGSPAIDAGVPVPDAWPDPMRESGKPDIGAIPAGETLKVGPKAAPASR